MTRKKTHIKTRRRRGAKMRIFARDYSAREGRWGAWNDPYEGKREDGRERWIRCYYCEEYVRVAHAEVSHIVAHCEGGAEDLDNLVLAHRECNALDSLRYNQPKGTREVVTVK